MDDDTTNRNKNTQLSNIKRHMSPRVSLDNAKCTKRRTVMDIFARHEIIRHWSRCSFEDLIKQINGNGGHAFCLLRRSAQVQCPSMYLL